MAWIGTDGIAVLDCFFCLLVNWHSFAFVDAWARKDNGWSALALFPCCDVMRWSPIRHIPCYNTTLDIPIT